MQADVAIPAAPEGVAAAPMMDPIMEMVVPPGVAASTPPEVSPQSESSPKKRLIVKAFFAICDQGLFAGSNFGVNLLFARRLTPADYGAYGAAFTGFLLLGLIHTSLLTEPMLVFGPGKRKDSIAAYLGAVIAGHLVVAGPGALLMAVVGLVCRHYGYAVIGAALLTLAAVSPFVLLLWLLRRACYLRMQPQRAAMAGMVYAAVTLVGLFILPGSGTHFLIGGLTLMGVASFAAALWLLTGLQPDWTRVDRAFTRSVLLDHWAYGRWAAGAGFVCYTSGEWFNVLLPMAAGLPANGAFQALSNFISPFTLAVSGGITLAGPILVRANEKGRMRPMVAKLTLLVLAASLGHWIVLGLLRHYAFQLLYGGRYENYSSIVWLIGLTPIAVSLTETFGAAVRVKERPDRVFWAYTAAAIFGVTAGTGMVIWLHVTGAVIATVACAGMAATMLARDFFKSDSPKSAEPAL